MTITEDYEVGYGKPPKQTQFKPGQSGNKRGRPKGRKNIATEFDEILTKQLPIRIDGKKQKMSVRAAVFQKQVELAFKGDKQAARLVLETAERHARDKTTTGGTEDLMREDAQILRAYAERASAETTEQTQIEPGASRDE